MDAKNESERERGRNKFRKYILKWNRKIRNK